MERLDTVYVQRLESENLRNTAPQAQNVRPMCTGFLKKRVVYAEQKARFGWEPVHELRIMAILHCEVGPDVTSQRNLHKASASFGKKQNAARTGRKRSRSHQTAWLVSAGDGPNTRMGSQSTRHSHMDHRLAKQASNRSSGGGMNGAVVASI